MSYRVERFYTEFFARSEKTKRPRKSLILGKSSKGDEDKKQIKKKSVVVKKSETKKEKWERSGIVFKLCKDQSEDGREGSRHQEFLKTSKHRNRLATRLQEARVAAKRRVRRREIQRREETNCNKRNVVSEITGATRGA